MTTLVVVGVGRCMFPLTIGDFQDQQVNLPEGNHFIRIVYDTYNYI